MRCVSSRHRKKGPRATTPLFANPWSSERSGEIGTVGVGSSSLRSRRDFLLRANPRWVLRASVIATRVRCRSAWTYDTLKITEKNAKYPMNIIFYVRIKSRVRWILKRVCVYSEMRSTWKTSIPCFLVSLFTFPLINRNLIKYKLRYIFDTVRKQIHENLKILNIFKLYI